ncbi:retrotransposon protein, putative, ty1-copia subclass [Tanacetum coccineum]|uniref:Retrotransposon protein, putative, ty1-copia subclass n=1 Tax=Tanacetum coccineum TaxID=301880 RepID=A0ABQ4YXV2_9ASTR
MVRSMFNLTTLPLSFWDYALESAVRILNMVPTKKVDKTPYEIWHSKAPNLSYLIDFIEKRYLSQEFSGRDYDLEDDHMDTLPSENTSENSVEPESLSPLTDLITVREPPPYVNLVRSKWLFKKKTDMDGEVHTYKARLVAKGFTQTYRIDFEETFSPVSDIRAIRILIAIAAHYDYEI